MKKKVLFIVDWPSHVENLTELQTTLDNNYSENYEWEVWSCKKRSNQSLIYRWDCYTKGALYALRNRKKYHAIFIWQQMVGYILFGIMRLINLKIPNVILFTFIYNSNTIFKYQKKQMVNNALLKSKGILWPSSEMANEVKKDFPKFESKNHSSLVPLMDVVDIYAPVAIELDDPYFRNGVYTAGKSERDFDVVIRAFRNTDIPVTIVCPDETVIKETNITSNIRILRFSKVSHEQYYALEGQAFCVVISLINETSACGTITITLAMSNSIPVIVTDSYGAREYIVNNVNGILVKVGDSDAMRQGYEKLKSDEAFRNNMINNAKNTVKGMSTENFIEKIIQIIEN